MAVPEYLRGEGIFDVTLKARELAAYTIRVCANPRIFKPELNTSITNNIVHLAVTIFLLCFEANEVNVRKNQTPEKLCKHVNARLDYQEEAYQKTEDLLALIHLASPIFHLKSKRIKYWGTLITDTQSMIYGWNISDRKRFSEYL